MSRRNHPAAIEAVCRLFEREPDAAAAILISQSQEKVRGQWCRLERPSGIRLFQTGALTEAGRRRRIRDVMAPRSEAVASA